MYLHYNSKIKMKKFNLYEFTCMYISNNVM